MSADAIIVKTDEPITVEVRCYDCGRFLPVGRSPKHECKRRRESIRVSIEWSPNVEY